MYDILELNAKLVGELREIANKLNISKAEVLKKQDLIYRILDEQALNPKESIRLKKKEKAESVPMEDNNEKVVKKNLEGVKITLNPAEVRKMASQAMKDEKDAVSISPKAVKAERLLMLQNLCVGESLMQLKKSLQKSLFQRLLQLLLNLDQKKH